MSDFDLIVIGAGSGGVRGARMAAKTGARVAIVEEGDVGGTCVLRGCIPKKLLVYASHFAEDFRDAESFGWDRARPGFDWARLIANKDAEIARLNRVYLKLLEDHGVTLIEGRARLTAPHSVEVDGRTLRAKTILVATGSWPVLPAIPGVEHAITSNEAFHLPRLPERIVIVGGGYIALEFAGIFHGLGSQVTLLVRGPEVLRGFDEDVRSALGAALGKSGIKVHRKTRALGIACDGDTLTLETDKGESIAADKIMFATGRMPNTKDLGLEEIGVRFAANGAVRVDEYSQTAVPGIYAVGDVTARQMLTPVALAEAAAFVETVFNGRPAKMDYRLVPSAVFSQPPVACVGLTEAEARREYPAVDVYRASYRPLKHTLTGREVKTFMKLIADGATGRVLGCHMVGDNAPEIVQGLAVALTCGATKAQFDATIGIHPTDAEEFVTLREKSLPPMVAA